MKSAFTLFLTVLLSLNGFSQSGKKTKTSTKKPFVLGIIDEIYSKELKEKRILNIYLPEGYSETDTLKYPVTYLLDGSADEDFIHVAGIYQFNNFEWVNQTPKSIIVGIATVDRRRDFTYPTAIETDKEKYLTSGHSDNFIAFIERELQPYIQQNYKVTEDKTIIGQSLGGLLATEILLKKPELFTNYIIISPSLWWNNGSLLNTTTALLEKISATTTIYIGVGKEGLSPTQQPRVMEVDANLLAEKITNAGNKNLKVYFEYLPQENHATISHQAIVNALRKIYATDRY
ncbi:alpha/beta hydrolase-fold protein [Flavobacterium sp. DG1-102-2]|uniref:alpha/beta hydrolase n=1 Tax=Flavobacterium sp. DG1-102-2 TaxID=3081663 RepID=UPI002948D555|nr:alpha/beta hydrolase-fold protein [Flavobacterium sp. DG1-102-2]MDV6168236.1 alpha/beta hydrolase-fold protein [Flavobacterium sp. DG1-102-2]